MIVTSRRVVAVVGVAAVVAAVAAGLVLVGSPADERKRGLDTTRVGDLIDLSAALDEMWASGELPASLDSMAGALHRNVNVRDPLTVAPYSYRVLGGPEYELCAVFDRDDRSEQTAVFWAHGAGRTCYRLEARPRRR